MEEEKKGEEWIEPTSIEKDSLGLLDEEVEDIDEEEDEVEGDDHVEAGTGSHEARRWKCVAFKSVTR